MKTHNRPSIAFANPFRSPGRWLKGNTHTHTVNSDGRLTCAEVHAKYHRAGYDFVFLTDHWKRTVPSSTFRKPMLLSASEIDFVVNGNMIHAVCLGLRREWQRRKFQSMQEFIRLAKQRHAYIIMAHPYWSGSGSEAYLCAEHFPAVEVYNTGCDRTIAKGYSGSYWDYFLNAGRRVFGVAADDMHLAAHACGGWIMVKAAAGTEPAILDALRRGHFYATQGPQLQDIQIEDERITVTCSPVRRINFVSNNYGLGKVVCANGRSLTKAEWEITPGVRYVRIECVDGDGRTAWSNPIWMMPDERCLPRLKRVTLQQAVVPRLRYNPAPGDPTRINWSAACILSDWKTLTGGTTRRQVEARLLHDGQFLYAQLEERLDPRRLLVKHNTVWDEDEWELFFARRRGQPCRQIGINARGVHRDKAHGEPDGAWSSAARVVSHTRQRNCWRVQVALPLARLLPGGVRPGQTIYLNLVRSTEQRQALAWIPTFGVYHEPNRLGAVRLA